MEKMRIRAYKYKPTPTNMFLTHSQSLTRLQSKSYQNKVPTNTDSTIGILYSLWNTRVQLVGIDG